MTQRDTPSSAISVGDMVAFVRWPCCGWKLGVVRTVNGFRFSNTARCGYCSADGPVGKYATLSPGGDGPVSWLKRIPPLSELEGVKTEEDIREPA